LNSWLSKQVNDLDERCAVDGLARFLDSNELVGMQQVRGCDVQRIHRPHAGFRGFLAGVIEDELEVVAKERSSKVVLVKAVFYRLFVEQRFG
jgi:hypothetical protein